MKIQYLDQTICADTKRKRTGVMKKKIGIIVAGILFIFIILIGNVIHNIGKQDGTEEKFDFKKWVKEDRQLKNVWIEKGEEKNVTILLNGQMYTLETENPLSETVKHTVGDLEITNEKVSKVILKPEKITGKVLVERDDYIEIEGYGKLELEDDFKVYRTYGQTVLEDLSIILVGYSTTDFVVANGKICAALVTKEFKPQNIRVLLKSQDYKEECHDKVVITSDSKYTVAYGKKSKEYDAGEKLTLNSESQWLKENGRVTIKSKEKDSKIKFFSFKRSQGNPSYRGSVEISLAKEGGLTVINELSLEEYLYAVIGSEMPLSHGEEALKVQAVCARSYAYQQLLNNSKKELGAHVDDSVSFQVYNNYEESQLTREAVDATKGVVLKVGNEVATAFYFSTSCGHTASGKEVWELGGNVGYLDGKVQSDNKKIENLTNEKVFKKFIDKKDKKAYDYSYPWYRWKVTLTAKDVKNSIDQNLEERYKANPNLILTQKDDGTYEKKQVGTIGTVRRMEVLKRGTGGIVEELKIIGSKAVVKILTEYNIRMILEPLSSTITRNDNTKIEGGLNLLPSAFFYIQEGVNEKTEEPYFIIHGGGYGHGVGMSQNGVKTLVDKGKKYDEVLKYYYTGTTFGNIY